MWLRRQNEDHETYYSSWCLHGVHSTMCKQRIKLKYQLNIASKPAAGLQG